MLEKKIYKNYKSLCEAMGWKPTGGDTKAKHIKELESMCRYHKEGNKFIIEEIYKESKPIADNRGKTKGNSTSKYGDSIKKLLFHMMAVSENGYAVVIPKNKAMETFYFVKEGYSEYNNNLIEFAKKHDLELTSVYDVFNSSYKNFIRVIDNALMKLNSKKLMVSNTFELLYIDGSRKPLKIVEDDNLISFILQTQNDVLFETNCEDLYEAKINNVILDLYSEVTKRIIKKTGNNSIIGYRQIYYCVATQDFIKELTKYKMMDDVYSKVISFIRQKARESAENTYIKRHKKAIKTVRGKILRIPPEKYHRIAVRASHRYPENCQQVIDIIMPK